MGRLTLNPLKHLDPLGTLMLIITIIKGMGFGWAKPVPINPMYYKNRRKGTMLVSVAGPLSNLLLATVFYTVSNVIYGKYNGMSLGTWDIRVILYTFSIMMINTNIGLAAFNLLPFPPLDGSKILGSLLSPQYYYKMLQYENYISLAFLLLVFWKPAALSIIMNPLTKTFSFLANAIASPIANLFI